MSKSFSFPNVGTCSRQTNIVLNDDHTIESVEVIGGCNGNLKGISRLLKGMKAEDAITRMEGTTCGPRPTSCPDQIAKNLKRLWQNCNQNRRNTALSCIAWQGGFLLCSALSVSLCSTALPKGEPTHRLNSAAPKGQAAIGSPLGGAGKADRL